MANREIKSTATLKIENIFDATAAVEKVFNTGLNAVAGGEAVIDDTDTTFAAERIASVRLYDGTGNANQYVEIKPGDSIQIVTTSYKETEYYLSLNDELLKVTDVTPG